ncbi:DUF4870 domain-containing protein, partial [Micromonospora sp. NPDC003776]
MTEPAPSPGGDPTRSVTGPDEAGSASHAEPASPWAAPGAGADEGPSAPPEGASMGYAPPPVAPGGPWSPLGPYPPAGPWGPPGQPAPAGS